MKIDVYDQKGKKLSKKVELPSGIFEAKVNEPLMAQAVRVYLSNQRQSTAHTKERGEVSGSTRKPWANNKIGRARVSMIRNPIWKGGGVVFGPRKERNFKRKLSKKMRRAAIFSAFSLAAKENRIVVLDDVDLKKEKLTKQVESIVSDLPVDTKILFIQGEKDEGLINGARNLEGVFTTLATELSAYKLLNHKYLIILTDALGKMEEMWKTEDRERLQKIVQKTQKKRERVEKSEKKVVLESLKLATRTMNALKKAGIEDVKTLKAKIEKGEKIKGVGKKSLEEIKSRI